MAAKSAAARGYGAEHRELRQRWVDLFAQGHTTPCACQRPACPHHRGPCLTTLGKTTPWDLGHTDDRRDWTGPECVPCNRSAGARNSNRAGVVMTRRAWCARSSVTPPRRTTRPARVVIVVGPPCSGKTTFVQDNAEPADLIVDYDAIAASLGSPVEHDHGRGMIDRVEAARNELLNEWLTSNNGDGYAWVILTRARQFGIVPSENIDRIVSISTPLKECERRAIKAGRADNVLRVIRGYGREMNAVIKAAEEMNCEIEIV